MKWPEQKPVKELGIEAVRVDREPKRMMGELPDPGPQPPQVITSSEVETARELELARRRARLEPIHFTQSTHDYVEHPTYTGPNCAMCGQGVAEHASALIVREVSKTQFLQRKLAEYQAVKAKESA